jgi:hypothetical protein
MLGRLVWTAAMSISAEREDLLNEVYDTEHIPELKRVPGVIEVRRFHRIRPARRRYLAVYEIGAADVPTSDAWLRARDLGRWPTEVRPWTSELVNGLYAWQSGFGGQSRADAARLVLLMAEHPADGVPSQPVVASSAAPDIVAGAHYVDLRTGRAMRVAAFEPAVASSRAGAPVWLGDLESAELFEPVGLGPAG